MVEKSNVMFINMMSAHVFQGIDIVRCVMFNVGSLTQCNAA
jgi:hypothetical protein